MFVHRKMKDLLIKSFDKKGGKIVDGKPQNSNFDANFLYSDGPKPKFFTLDSVSTYLILIYCKLYSLYLVNYCCVVHIQSTLPVWDLHTQKTKRVPLRTLDSHLSLQKPCSMWIKVKVNETTSFYQYKHQKAFCLKLYYLWKFRKCGQLKISAKIYSIWW